MTKSENVYLFAEIALYKVIIFTDFCRHKIIGYYATYPDLKQKDFNFYRRDL